jgi:hypothetical protein
MDPATCTKLWVQPDQHLPHYIVQLRTKGQTLWYFMYTKIPLRFNTFSWILNLLYCTHSSGSVVTDPASRIHSSQIRRIKTLCEPKIILCNGWTGRHVEMASPLHKHLHSWPAEEAGAKSGFHPYLPSVQAKSRFALYFDWQDWHLKNLKSWTWLRPCHWPGRNKPMSPVQLLDSTGSEPANLLWPLIAEGSWDIFFN